MSVSTKALSTSSSSNLTLGKAEHDQEQEVVQSHQLMQQEFASCPLLLSPSSPVEAGPHPEESCEEENISRYDLEFEY